MKFANVWIIKAEHLREIYACNSHVVRFEEMFPNGCDMLSYDDVLKACLEVGLDIGWFFTTVFGSDREYWEIWAQVNTKMETVVCEVIKDSPWMTPEDNLLPSPWFHQWHDQIYDAQRVLHRTITARWIYQRWPRFQVELQDEIELLARVCEDEPAKSVG